MALPDIFKPSSTGVLAGAGIGTTLGALGYLKNKDLPDSQKSLLTNPALLAALGASGGYLAGNAYEQIPTSSPLSLNDNLNRAAILGLAGGTGYIGSELSGALAKKESVLAAKEYSNTLKKLTHNGKIDLDKLHPIAKAHLYDKEEVLAKALKRKGAFGYADDIYRIRNGKTPSLSTKVLDRVLYSKYSPLSWLRAPVKLIQHGKLLKASRKVLGSKRGIVAAAAILAGAGKLTYDKLKED